MNRSSVHAIYTYFDPNKFAYSDSSNAEYIKIGDPSKALTSNIYNNDGLIVVDNNSIVYKRGSRTRSFRMGYSTDYMWSAPNDIRKAYKQYLLKGYIDIPIRLLLVLDFDRNWIKGFPFQYKESKMSRAINKIKNFLYNISRDVYNYLYNTNYEVNWKGANNYRLPSDTFILYNPISKDTFLTYLHRISESIHELPDVRNPFAISDEDDSSDDQNLITSTSTTLDREPTATSSSEPTTASSISINPNTFPAPPTYNEVLESDVNISNLTSASEITAASTSTAPSSSDNLAKIQDLTSKLVLASKRLSDMEIAQMHLRNDIDILITRLNETERLYNTRFNSISSGSSIQSQSQSEPEPQPQPDNFDLDNFDFDSFNF